MKDVEELDLHMQEEDVELINIYNYGINRN